jgi:hypothetical protein
LGEALANKFTGQVKKTRNSVVEPTRFVKIDTLPITATTEDIRKLAREAFSDGDKSIIESEFFAFLRLFYSILSNLPFINLVVFCRNEEFGFYGRCVVLMSKPEDARRLINYGNRRLVGGNIIKMAYVSYIGSGYITVSNFVI